MRLYCVLEPSGNDMLDEIRTVYLDRVRYQFMWHLRHLEDQMNAEEEGKIIMYMNERESFFKVCGFSDELTEKIDNICKSVDLNSLKIFPGI